MTRELRIRRLRAALCALALLGSTSTDPATQAVRATLERAREVVEVEAPRNEQLSALGDLARELFDSAAMGRHALGAVFDTRPPDEQAEFLALFDDFIVRAYLQKLLFFRKPRFGYARPQVLGDAVLVRTVIESGRDEFYVNYKMTDASGAWRATDIVVEGVSLIENYRAQFSNVLENASFAELLEKMRRKTRRLRDRDTAS